MRDFTLKIYKELLQSLIQKNYSLINFSYYLEMNRNDLSQRFVIMRHDVDERPQNALQLAKIENAFGIKATYYFRVAKLSNVPSIIKEIADMGHEIGYHYEDYAACHGDLDSAIVRFKNNLDYFRTYYPVNTICMHGSPLSKWDSRDLWKKYDYKIFGLIGEPYFDIDFSKVFYLTDTGRRWDGFKVSRRDRIPQYQDQWEKEGLVFHATQDIIDAANKGRLPSQIMITVHPQRWTNKPIPWTKELVWQGIKNQVKRLLVK